MLEIEAGWGSGWQFARYVAWDMMPLELGATNTESLDFISQRGFKSGHDEGFNEFIPNSDDTKKTTGCFSDSLLLINHGSQGLG